MNKDRQFEITAYTDAPATGTDKSQAVKRLMACYPGTFNNKTDNELAEFMQVFSEAVEAVGMTGKQLKDAVITCIATKHQFGAFQIADVTGFTDKIKLYTYQDYERNPINKVSSELLRADGVSRWFVDVENLPIANRLAKLQKGGKQND